MTVLGIDTSAIVCSVALVSDEKILSEKTISNGLTHSETLLPLIGELLGENHLDIKDVDCFAISTGPGSFTGLRIGISTVKGLAISLNKPCFSASTLEALALNASHFEGKIICPVMDARRGEFYNALFSVQSGKLIRLCPDRALPGSEIYQEISDMDYFILGDGAEKFAEQNPGAKDRLVPEGIRRQSGVSVAKLALQEENEKQYVFCNALSPKYIRIPQAEREYLKNKKESEK